MKLPIFFFLLLSQSIYASREWEAFKAKYEKVYKNEEEENHRRNIFLKNLEIINTHNEKYEKGLTTFKMGINEMADTTKKDRPYSSSNVHKFSPGPNRFSRRKFVPSAEVPESIDWRDYGVITSVPDQSFCNSCWAFAVVGTIEAYVGIYEGRSVSLSQQNLVECVDPDFECYMEMPIDQLNKTYQYIIDSGGIDTYDSYPYDYAVEDCSYKTETSGASITGYGSILEADEEDLKRVVGTIGPVTVEITTNYDFDLYFTGVYYNADCMSAPEIYNHAVIIVGYGNEDGQDYWLVRNSWGTWFGEEGYIKMARNRDNNCGIASYARYPIM